MGLSAIVLTFNEESNIERCLQSLSFADEIVVVDSNSTDRTVEIARRYTDKIYSRAFAGFSEQRNAAMEFASNEWVLFVDADEVVTTELANEIVKAISSGNYDAYKIPRINHFIGRPIKYCGWYPDYIVRLARKSKAHYPDRLVHETMEISGTIGKLKHFILHYSYCSINDYFNKIESYALASAKQKYNRKKRSGFIDLFFKPGYAFIKKYIIQKGFREGLYGLVISMLSAYSVFFKYALLWEMSVREENFKE